MFGFHGWDLLLVLLIVLLIFGARRLPEFGASLGQSFRMLQKGLDGDDQTGIEAPKEGKSAQQTETTKESDR
jgi:sec-independent protein translocase protein TatA